MKKKKNQRRGCLMFLQWFVASEVASPHAFRNVAAIVTDLKWFLS